MNNFIENNWHSGSERPVKFSEIVLQIKNCVQNGGKVFIGSDSFISKRKVTFATAICLHGDRKGGRYFFTKDYSPISHYTVLVSRMTEEVRRSVELAEHVMEEYNIDPNFFELHVDVSPFELKMATSKFSDMLSGYVSGAGFECRIKPNAWASQTVADKHSK
jgi:hypothetical protein